MTPPLITIAAAARELGVFERTLFRWAYIDGIPILPIRHVDGLRVVVAERVDLPALRTWLAARPWMTERRRPAGIDKRQWFRRQRVISTTTTTTEAAA